ncbi:MAG: redoxin family protein [Bryobacteraceae bacterium]
MRAAAWSFAVALSLAAGLAQSPIALGTKIDTIAAQTTAAAAEQFSTAGHVTAVIFIATQCPVSNAYNERMKALYSDYSAKGVQFIFLNANSTEPASEVEQHRAAKGFPFPVYKDVNNVFADKVGAAVTPHAFVFDARGTLAYRGPIDNSRNPDQITQHTLGDALDAVLAGRPVPVAEAKAFGCSIKRVR